MRPTPNPLTASDFEPSTRTQKESEASDAPAYVPPSAPAAPTGEEKEIRPLPLEGFVDERQAVPIASFVDGFAAGWFIAVPEAFKEALDIMLTPRTFIKQDDEGQPIFVMVPVKDWHGNDKRDKDGNVMMRKKYLTVTESFWTQGRLFSFNKGDVFYDTREAYTDKPWSEVIKEVGYCIQIKEASPSTLAATKKWRTSEPVSMFEDDGKSPRGTVRARLSTSTWLTLVLLFLMAACALP